MREPRSSLVVAISAIFLLIAHAPAMATEKGWYLGFMVGQSELVDTDDISEFCNTAFISCDGTESDTAFQFFGGYQVNNYFAAELAYIDIGSPSYSVTALVPVSAEATMQGGVLSILPQIPLGSFGALFGRIGLAGGNAEVNAQVPALGLVSAESSVAGTFVYGIGGAINLGRRVTLRLDWTRFAFDETLNLAGSDIVTPDVDILGASFVFRFPKN